MKIYLIYWKKIKGVDHLKKFTALFLTSIVALTALFSSNTYAAGENNQEFTFSDGNKAYTYH